MRTWARCLVALGFSPFPGSDSLLTFVHAPLARCSLFVKCWCVEWLSCSQNPSHLTDLAGLMIVPFRETGMWQREDLSIGVFQWMRSVFGTEKVRFRALALLEMTRNILWRIRTFVRYEGEEMVSPKSST
jgi:hypothetical protein